MSDDVTRAAQQLRGTKNIRDAVILAEAYLLEHLEDDDEAIDEEWFWAQKPRRFGSKGDIWLLWYGGEGMLLCINGKRESLPHIKTRGQLRRLVRALTPCESNQPGERRG